MTVQTNSNVANFNGDGANKVFPIGYKFNSAADLVVLLLDDSTGTTQILTLNSDFTVTGAGDEEGGAVTLVTAPALTQRLKVTRVVDVLQLTDLRNQGKFYAEIHEDAFDLLTMIAQQHESEIALSLRVSESDSPPARIPPTAQRAGKFLAFDMSGNPTAAAPVADSSSALRLDLANGTALVSPDAIVGGALTKGEILDAGTSAPGTSVTRGYVHAYYPDLAGALRIGGSDLEPLNDERGYWSGLPNPDAWGDPANIGLYSASFNRNGAAYGVYSNTFGHDCVTYGAASLAGGAGSATGNPSTPSDPFAGYCSFTYGKNNLAAGQKCAALGEEHVANTRAAMAFGYAHSLQPSAATPEPVGASAIGSSNNVTGQGHAIGNHNIVADGIVIGDHIIGEPESVTIGYQVTSLRMHKPGPSGRGFVGVNNSRTLEHEVDIDLGDGQTCAITTDSFGSSHFALRGVNGAGLSHAILDIEWTNPSSGTAAGEIKLRVNGRAAVAFGIESDGSIYMEELKDATTVAGKRKGTLFVDAGVLKVQP